MDGLTNNPLLQPQYIAKVLDSIIPDVNDYMLTLDVPMVTQDSDVIMVDIRQTMGGMTMAVADGAESPIIDKRGRQQFSFQPAHFREKVLLSEKDIKSIRKIGTVSETERAQDVVTDIVGQLRMRVETRMEWAKWEMIKGSLAIAQSDVAYTIDYKIPTWFKPTLTGADLWSASTSDPVDDILTWLLLYRDDGIIPDHIVFNAAVEQALLQNSKIRTIRDAMFTGQSNPGMLTRDNLQMIFKAYSGIPYKVYDRGYYHVMKLLTPITNVSTTFTVDENPGVAIGDTVTVVHKLGERTGIVRIPITNVVGTTFTHVAIGGAITYSAGSEVRIKKFFVPDNKFIIRGRLPAGTTGGTNFAEFVAINHVYGPGGLMNPQPGIFSKVVVDEDGDPPKIEIIAGVSGLPVLYYPRCNVVATVL